MRRLCGWFADVLPFEARGRRAVEETLGDWDEEAAVARSRGDGLMTRAAISARSSAALARAVAAAGVRETFDVPSAALLGRLLLFLIPVAAWSAATSPFWSPQATPWAYRPEVFAGLMAMPAVLAMPLAVALVAGTWPRRLPFPGAGMLLLSSVLLLAMFAVAPAAFAHTTSLRRHLLQLERGFFEGPAGLVDRGLIDGLALAADRLATLWAARWPGILMGWLSLSILVAVWGTLGSAIRLIEGRRKLFWLAAVVAAYALAPEILERAGGSLPLWIRVPYGSAGAAVVLTLTLFVGVPLWMLRRVRREAGHGLRGGAAAIRP